MPFCLYLSTPASTIPFYLQLIVINLRRDPTLGLIDKLSALYKFRLSSILKDKFRSLLTQQIYVNYILLNKLGILIKREQEVNLDQKTCKLGWKFKTYNELSKAYYTIITKGTLYNILSVMYNINYITNSLVIMRLLLQSLIPSDLLFAPSRCAAKAARRRPKVIASTPGASTRSPPPTTNELVEADIELRDNT